MKINRQGISRTVFIFEKVVVKVPTLRNGWYWFIVGICSNIEERKAWQSTQSNLLCPVIRCGRLGLWLTMKKAVVHDGEKLIDFSPWIKAGFGGDDKPDNYGWIWRYDEKHIGEFVLVKIDYPNHTDQTR